MKEENDKLYLEKKHFFDKKKAIEEIIKETDRKNVFFMRFNEDKQLYAVKFELGEFYYKRIGYPNFDMKKHV